MSPPHSHAVVGSPPQGNSTTAPVSSQGVNVASQAQSAAEKQAAIASEKRRRRRESHNAVERRRRDNINEKISELATLIPECMLDVGNTNTTPNLDDQLLSPISPTDSVVPPLKREDDASTPSASAADNGVVKANKGMILRKSVEYIRYLQQLVTAQGARNRELEQELKAYRSSNKDGVASSTSPEASSSSLMNSLSSVATQDEDRMVLAAEAAAGFDFTLPTTHEDDEMLDDPGHLHQQQHQQQDGDSEVSLSPAASGSDGDMGSLSLHEERGRTRDVVGGRRGLVGMNSGEGMMAMGVAMVAMET